MPERVFCHALLRDSETEKKQEATLDWEPETLTGDLWFYSTEGTALGGLTGFALKRATRASLLSATEDLQDLLYEVLWRDSPLQNRLRPADDLAAPAAIASETGTFEEYLNAEGVHIDERAELLSDLERLSRAYALAALEKLGWRRENGGTVDPGQLGEQLSVISQHSRLLERMLRLLADAGVLERTPEAMYRVLVGESDPLPDEALSDAEAFADRSVERHLHGENEIGLLGRSGSALAEVLLGEVDP